MTSFIVLLLLVGVAVAAVWTAVWSLKKLGLAALGPLAAGAAAGLCLVVTLVALLPLLITHAEDPRQPELNAVEAGEFARANTMLDCRESGGDAGWCDGFIPARIDRNCAHAWFVILASADRKQVRRVLVRARGGYDKLTGSDDDPSPGERASFARHPPGQPEVDEDLGYCRR